jgi:diguanylate cyclase (GGDEF)-like protein
MSNHRAVSGTALWKFRATSFRSRVRNAFRLPFFIAACILALSPLYALEGTSRALIGPGLPLILDRPADLPRSLFPFRSYGADSGLGNLAVRRIVQDSVGFLWVGTEDGLYRYDGNEFARFDSSNGLPSTWITDLLATPEGNLWVCTPQGLATQKGEGFEAAKTANGLPAGACHAVARDSRGAIWVAHKNGLFFQRDHRFHQLAGFPAGPANAIVSLPGSSSAIFAAAKGLVIRIDNYHIIGSLPVSPGSVEPVDSLAVDNSGRIWAQSARKLFSLVPGSVKFRDESAGLPAISSRGVLSTDRDGRLWVPTDEGMSCRVGEKWQHFGPKDGLPNDCARYIFEDREGSLWVGSVGVHRLVGRGSWTSWRQAQGLPSDTVWDIHRSRRGDLWIATDKGLCLATSNGWRVLPGTEKTVVRRIYEDQKGRLWIGLMPAAILRYDPVSGQMVRYGSSLGVAGIRVLCLEEDVDGQLWAATDGGGLLRYRPERNDFVREPVPGGTPEETFRYILSDRDGRLWATGEYGLLLRSGGKWRRFCQKDGLLRDHVSYITQVHSGDLWLSYFEPLGIIRFRMDRDKLRILERRDRENGLSSEKVYLLGEDLNHNLWVGTGKGIDIISQEGTLHFSKGDGVAGDDIDAMAFMVETNGSIFIGTSSGLSLCRSDFELDRIQAPIPVILSANLNDRPLKSGSDAVRKFPHRFNMLRVDFAVLSFLHETQIEYGTRLRGLETEWHLSRTGEARYPGLAPGSYVYEVRSRLGSGPWSSPVSFTFEILQPLWRTWPALATWLVLIASAVFAGFRWRLQRLHKRTHQLETLVSARTIELAIANSDLERLSITDPLTGLKNRRFLEFSIAEDLARVRRSFQYIQGEWHSLTDEVASISFLVVDIDHFKRVNDRFGHAAGDRVLRQMGSVFASAVRESDTTVRWGGEEFLIIARGTRGNDAATLAERIRKQVESVAFAVSNDETMRLTCCIGFSSWPLFKRDPDALGWQEILALADRCLYLAKNSGRNAWMGVTVRSDYRGNADPGVLNDFRAAEAQKIIKIQSSASEESNEPQYPYSPFQSTESRTFY